MATDLRFRSGRLTTPPIDLVFGAVDVLPPSPEATLDVDGTIAVTVTGDVNIFRVQKLAVDAVLSVVIEGHGLMEYESRASRPVTNSVEAPFQDAIGFYTTHAERMQDAVGLRVSDQQVWQDAAALQIATLVKAQDAIRLQKPQKQVFQDALPLGGASASVRWQTAIPRPNLIQAVYQDAIPLYGFPASGRFQEAIRTSQNSTRGRFQEAIPMVVSWRADYQNAKAMVEWIKSRYQDAIQPQPGKSLDPPVPGPDPCYLPPLGDVVDLLFAEPWTNSPHLVFICERHGDTPPPDGETIIVPIRKVYIVINTTSLALDDGTPIHAYGMSVAIDVDSYTWSFNSSLYATELNKVLPNSNGEPVIVRAMINGVLYRMLIENVSRDRKFNDGRFTASGRGLASLLDDPYSPVLNFGNTTTLTAQQLMQSVLTENGESLGWDLDFQLTDWDVPPNIWTLSGSRIAALRDIAEAAGGYLQTHPNSQIIKVFNRYPLPPWEWAGATPDIQLPAAPNSSEKIDWIEKPRYNRVFVSGVNQGVLAQVTRTGTAGDLVAPGVNHPLILDDVVARQRGVAVLSDTGKTVNVALTLPVLPETGVILPGKLIRYVDGATTRLGLTRSVSVDVAFPNVNQTVLLETHP